MPIISHTTVKPLFRRAGGKSRMAPLLSEQPMCCQSVPCRNPLGTTLLLLAAIVGCDSSGPSEDTPFIVSIAPKELPPNVGQIDLIVNGRNFVAGSEVLWNESPRPTTVVNPYRLQATIFTADLRNPGTARIVVENSKGRSRAISFIVSDSFHLFDVAPIAPNEGEINVGTAFTLRFNDDVEPTSLNDTTLTLTAGTGPVPMTIAYDRAQRTATVTATLVPLEQYTLHLSDLVRSTSRAALWGTRTWFYSTPLVPVRTVDQGGDFPSLAFLTGDSPRIAYRSFSPPGLKLASCAGSCAAGGWTNAVIAPGGAYVSLVVTAGTTTHATYEGPFGEQLAYVRGTSTPVSVDVGSGAWSAIAAEPNGRLHVVYHGGNFRHATCIGPCATMASWTRDTVDSDAATGGYAAVAVDAKLAVHTVYMESISNDLRYAFCPSVCVQSSWTRVTIDSTGFVGLGASLAIDGSGGLHVAYVDQTADRLKYATCSAACTDATNWTIVPIADLGPNDFEGWYATGIAIAPSGALAVSYVAHVPQSLRAASCGADCTVPGSWQSTLVSRRTGSYQTSLKIDASGTRHVAWVGPNNAILYAQY